jgi:hypothetical protein
LRIFSGLATDVPPNFCTMRGMEGQERE